MKDVLLYIEDDLDQMETPSERWSSWWVVEGISEIESYLAKHNDFFRFLNSNER